MFYGWRVVAGAFVSQMTVVGFFTYSVSLLIPHLRQEFGVSLEQVMYSLTLGTFLGMFVQPLAGVLVDRAPVRWLMTGGLLYFALGLLAMAQSSSIEFYIVAYALCVSIVNSFAGSLPATAVISRWFTGRRGQAIGIASVGTSVGGIAIPALLAWLLSFMDWRSALEVLALVIAFGLMPFVALTIRGKPEDVGLQAENAAGVVDPASAATESGMAAMEIVRHHGYWCIGISVGLLISVYSASLNNFTPYALNLGHSEAQASLMIMTVAVSGLVGKLVFGLLADRISLKHGLWSAQGLVVGALLIMAQQPAFHWLLLAATLQGLAAGGMMPFWGAMIARIFGVMSYGRAMGLMGPLITLCVMPSYALIGRLVDSTGSFQIPMLVFAAALTLGALLLLPLKLPDAQPQISVNEAQHEK